MEELWYPGNQLQVGQLINHPLLEVFDTVAKEVSSHWIPAPVEVACVFDIPTIWSFVLDGLIPILAPYL